MSPRAPFDDEPAQEPEPPVLDLDVWERRQRRRAEREQRRRRARHRRIGALAGAAAAVLIAGGGAVWALSGHGGGGTGTAGGTDGAESARARAPVGTVAEDPGLTATTGGGRDATGAPTTQAGAMPRTERSLRAQAARAAGATAGAGATASASGRRPVVWVQAGHVPPGEPGYMAQTGAGGGPFGSEQAFNTRTQRALIAWLARRGVDARATPALMTPWGARGRVFVSIHFDAPGGGAAIGHAIRVPGRHENYYEGQGTGTASPTPYADSAPHRDHTEVTPAVEAASTRLAQDVAARYRRVFTAGNGARSSWRGVEPRSGNPRMMHFYGYYRTNADARVLIECGAAGADDALLARTDLIAGAVGRGIIDHLHRTGALSRAVPATG